MTNTNLTLAQIQQMIKDRKEEHKRVLQRNLERAMSREEILREIEKRLFNE